MYDEDLLRPPVDEDEMWLLLREHFMHVRHILGRKLLPGVHFIWPDHLMEAGDVVRLLRAVLSFDGLMHQCWQYLLPECNHLVIIGFVSAQNCLHAHTAHEANC